MMLSQGVALAKRSNRQIGHDVPSILSVKNPSFFNHAEKVVKLNKRLECSSVILLQQWNRTDMASNLHFSTFMSSLISNCSTVAFSCRTVAFNCCTAAASLNKMKSFGIMSVWVVICQHCWHDKWFSIHRDRQSAWNTWPHRTADTSQPLAKQSRQTAQDVPSILSVTSKHHKR